jgi:hypothetical protein
MMYFDLFNFKNYYLDDCVCILIDLKSYVF